jgi:hypothetical protein
MSMIAIARPSPGQSSRTAEWAAPNEPSTTSVAY